MKVSKNKRSDNNEKERISILEKRKLNKRGD